ncbi:MAG: hypothetical protein IKP68_12455 [Clostridia bacterium]|nr:hypothetical protein [Clostridia bacterium]MBR7083200.1 hypothetical protein [Clostridia bacterium]
MKKTLCIILALAFSLLVFVGCQKEPDKPKETKLSTFDFQNEYSITELEEFFGELPSNEQLEYSDYTIGYITQKETLEKFHAEYSVTISNQSGNISPDFVVYKVKEGGYYYVFFNISGLTPEETYVGFTAHLTKLCKKSDFRSIKAGKSTAADVAKIDPAMEMTFMMSSGIYSMSLLEGGNIFVVKYKHSDKGYTSRNDLVVEKTFVDEDFAGCWSGVSPEDLP